MPTSKPPVLEAVAPILQVSDLARSIDYYEQVLGFSRAWTWGDPPYIASVCRDRVEFNLTLREASTERRVGRVYVTVSGIDHYFALMSAAGARIAIPLADRPYGMKDCRILDPDDNVLSFGEAIP